MKAISMVAVAAIAFGLAAPASAATTDPEAIIYRFTGARDTGGAANTGIATVFHCTNFSGVDETLRFVTRFSTGGLASNVPRTISHLATESVATKLVAAYGGETELFTGAVTQGTTAVAATSINVICTATTIDASAAVPVGVALRGIRFSPVPGSQE